jgi:hypothetical protein
LLLLSTQFLLQNTIFSSSNCCSSITTSILVHSACHWSTLLVTKQSKRVLATTSQLGCMRVGMVTRMATRKTRNHMSLWMMS